MDHTGDPTRRPDETRATEIEAKTLLRKQKRIDPLFLSSYSMNLYRGCAHGCVYCDGMAEQYRVPGEFGKDVSVKTNAARVLDRELDQGRKRTAPGRGYVLVGGGVGDSYQPLEERYRLSRSVLEVLLARRFPAHLLTKSSLVLRDLDLLLKLREAGQVLVSFSFSTADDETSAVFEPGASSPRSRLEAISTLTRSGIPCGIYLMPAIPFITDSPGAIRSTISRAKEAGARFVVFGGMTLKEGRQKERFYEVIRERYPEKEISFDIIYPGDPWGNPSEEYTLYLNEVFLAASRGAGLPRRIPPGLFPAGITMNERVALILEHLEHLARTRGVESTWGWAARSIHALETPITGMRSRLRSISGVGPSTERLVREIIDTGTCSYYERAMRD